MLAALMHVSTAFPAAAAVDNPPAIAGLAPDRRPVTAPVVRAYAPEAQARTRQLFGIAEPLPQGLGFLKDQGAWYTPFDRPGMPGPYDLRGWHRKP